ncbi:MAG: hypothetical protein IJP35_08240 [Clostridia bacterium]|nr:hypothetical protein [Clostridia bacterium]
MNGYQNIMDELDRRIATLKKHGGPTEKTYDNQYAELMDAVARIVGVALLKELEDVRHIVAQAASVKCE